MRPSPGLGPSSPSVDPANVRTATSGYHGVVGAEEDGDERGSWAAERVRRREQRGELRQRPRRVVSTVPTQHHVRRALREKSRSPRLPQAQSWKSDSPAGLAALDLWLGS
jgi:hypothetical protein